MPLFLRWIRHCHWWLPPFYAFIIITYSYYYYCHYYYCHYYYYFTHTHYISLLTLLHYLLAFHYYGLLHIYIIIILLTLLLLISIDTYYYYYYYWLIFTLIHCINISFSIALNIMHISHSHCITYCHYFHCITQALIHYCHIDAYLHYDAIIFIILLPLLLILYYCFRYWFLSPWFFITVDDADCITLLLQLCHAMLILLLLTHAIWYW